MPDPAENDDKTPDPKPKKQKGFLARVWNGIFRRSGDDYEKRLQYLSKEEASVHARMKRRAQGWRITARNVVLVSVVAEVVAVIYAIITTRSLDLSWQMRAMRVSPMFLLPGLSFVIYSALASFIRMRDRKDQKTLERLRSERKAKIDELKERTNYYTTQQLIQRYDLDPTAKAAAATVLASKLGADSGLNVYLGDESKSDATTGKSNDVKLVQSDGLRNRKQPASRNQSPAAGVGNQFVSDEMSQEIGSVGQQSSLPGHRVEHYRGSGPNEGGWIARIAAMLVGEDPTQSYALICGNCHMHNGLARKEDFPYVTYYCPHCQALNGPSQQEELQHGSGTVSGSASPLANGDAAVTRTPSSTSSMHSEADGAGAGTTAPVQEHPVKQSNAEGSIGPT